MGSTTLPDLPGSITYAHAQAIVAYVTANASHQRAYPYARGNDWGVTISGPTERGADLCEAYESLVDIELIKAPVSLTHHRTL